jgi:hypothetical protein
MQYQAQPGRQEWVTAVECTCADETVIPPLIIFKGENMVESWLPKNIPLGWKFSFNSQGWTSNIHGLELHRQCFEPTTREKGNGRLRLLLYDGHDSHISGDFIRQCMRHFDAPSSTLISLATAA